MKIRTGFVSNSSSSSFLIYGAVISRSELADLIKAKKAAPEDVTTTREALEEQLEAATAQYKEAQKQYLATEDKYSTQARVLVELIHSSKAEQSRLENELDKLDEYDEDDIDVYSELETLLEDTGLEYHVPCDDYYIGMSWDEVGLDETGRQFMERVQAKLKEALGKDFTCESHSECWYN